MRIRLCGALRVIGPNLRRLENKSLGLYPVLQVSSVVLK